MRVWKKSTLSLALLLLCFNVVPTGGVFVPCYDQTYKDCILLSKRIGQPSMVSSELECFDHCLRQVGCLSYNFHYGHLSAEGALCEVNGQTHKQVAAVDFLHGQGVQYRPLQVLMQKVRIKQN